LLTVGVIKPDSYLFTVSAGGTAKRTQLTTDNWRPIRRGGLGVKVANLPEDNGELVGALVVEEDDEVLVIMEQGKIVRSAVAEVRPTGRATQGVTFAKPSQSDRIIAVARNVERKVAEDSDNVAPVPDRVAAEHDAAGELLATASIEVNDE
ncbi:MAG: DNA gyrase subunit A, partial [Promicromonosporaceae bacterium]|nr:DNA gyrase subunit A [Promicromonosporaceae bacterium]